MTELRGKRSELLEEAVERGKFKMAGVVMSIYDDRGSAKETLQLFRENGWIEVETHGVFKVTEEGREKWEEENGEEGSSDSSLDSFA